MFVADFMTPHPLTVLPEDNLRTAFERMAQGGRHLPVLDEDGDLVGIVTDRDLRLAVNSPLIMRERAQDETLLETAQVASVMSSPVYTTHPEASLREAAQLMLDKEISGLVVVDGAAHIVGVISMTDLMRGLIQLLSPSAGANSG
ncbi:MAG: CBS domain-containing protein [Anaerolineae bacterium]|nr:CBS domain-containing protein [Anaerolineae bacterium]